MPFSHFIWTQPLPTKGIGTRVSWSLNPTGRAIVFVHGFGGKAVSTWSQFPSLLEGYPECAGHDIFFYGYDGLHTEAISSADKLRDFITDICSSPQAVYALSDAEPQGRLQHPDTYQEVIIVAHSLGAIVSRRALIDAYTTAGQAAWARRTHLVLFAPAHRGARISSLVRLSPLGAAMSLLALAQLLNKYRVLEDLQEGSGALTDLARDLEAAFGPRKRNLRARHVVRAVNDTIVRNANLPPDAAAQSVDGQSHTSICKPTSDFRLPLEVVVSSL
jgi:alpha-beta hydrolase superfamily lysophospholipase